MFFKWERLPLEENARMRFQWLSLHVSLVYLRIRVTVDKCHLDLFLGRWNLTNDLLILKIKSKLTLFYDHRKIKSNRLNKNRIEIKGGLITNQACIREHVFSSNRSIPCLLPAVSLLHASIVISMHACVYVSWICGAMQSNL